MVKPIRIYGDDLLKRYCEFYDCDERSAREVLDSWQGYRLLKLLATDAGLLEEGVLDPLERTKEQLEADRQALELERKNLKEERAELDSYMKSIEATQNRVLETAEMRDRVRAMEIFRYAMNPKNKEEKLAVIEGCARILTGWRGQEDGWRISGG